MKAKFVTERDYNPNPEMDGIPFLLTDSERSLAAVAATQIERNRRRQNERDAMQALSQWKGAMHRESA